MEEEIRQAVDQLRDVLGRAAEQGYVVEISMVRIGNYEGVQIGRVSIERRPIIPERIED